MSGEPFWESGYLDDEAEVFGEPSAEIVRLASSLPAGSRVLDAGCGEGRNALHLARAGHRVDASDKSGAGVSKLRDRADAEGLLLHTWVGDLQHVDLTGPYDMVVCHGVLHLLERSAAASVIRALQAITPPGGVNVVCVFTDRLPSPPDLAPFTPGLFREGALADAYAGWRLEENRRWVFEDEQPGGIRHTHAAEKVVAWRRDS